MTTQSQFETALQIFANRIVESDAPAAEWMAGTIATMLGVDYTEHTVARFTATAELDAQIRCATRILATRTAQGDKPAARHTALTLALLTAKRAQRREAGLSVSL